MNKLTTELESIARALVSGIKDLRVSDISTKSEKDIIKLLTKLMRRGSCKVFSRGKSIELSWSINRGKDYPIMLGEMTIVSSGSSGLDIRYVETDLIHNRKFRQEFNLRPHDKLSILLDIDYSAKGFLSEQEGLLASADALNDKYDKKELELNKLEAKLNKLFRGDEDTSELESEIDSGFEEISSGRERLRDTLQRSNLLTIWQRL